MSRQPQNRKPPKQIVVHRTKKPHLRQNPRSKDAKKTVIQGDINTISSSQKKQIALDMRLSGHSEWDIAKALNVSQPRISQILKEILIERTQAIAEMGDELRTLELERLDVMMLAWYAKAQQDTRALEGFLRIMERRNKLMGLEISRTELSGPNGAPIRMTSSSIDLSKLGKHADGDRLLANLEEIMMIAGPKVDIPKDELPALEHKPKEK